MRVTGSRSLLSEQRLSVPTPSAGNLHGSFIQPMLTNVLPMPPANSRAAEARGLICARRTPRMQLLKICIRTALSTFGRYLFHLLKTGTQIYEKDQREYERTKSRFVLMYVFGPTCSLSLLLILIILTQSCGISLIPAVPTVESFCSFNMPCGRTLSHFTSLLTTMFRSESCN